MRKPSPADFQLSETTLDEAKRIRRVLVILALAWTVIGFSVGAHIGKEAWPLIVLTVPPYGPFIFYYAAKATARFLLPTFGRAVAYEAAVQRYEQWWTRTQSSFWSSLSGRAFEVELASLYCRLGFNARVTPIRAWTSGLSRTDIVSRSNARRTGVPLPRVPSESFMERCSTSGRWPESSRPSQDSREASANTRPEKGSSLSTFRRLSACSGVSNDALTSGWSGPARRRPLSLSVGPTGCGWPPGGRI